MSVRNDDDDEYPDVWPTPPSADSQWSTESATIARRYSNASCISPLERVLQQHDREMDQHPRRACTRLSAFAAGVGVALSGARAAVAAYLTPASAPMAERIFHFRAVFQTCVPIYVLPFVLVSQYDCWTAVADRRTPHRRRFYNDAANDLG